MDFKREDNKHSQKKLDLEFQRILRIIKPYIPCIMDNYYLTLYRLWLEKLSELGVQEKEERNRYLIELCHQIQDGILEKPFTLLPPSGPLPPLRDHLQNKKEHQEKVTTKDLQSYFSNSRQCRKSNTITQIELLENAFCATPKLKQIKPQQKPINVNIRSNKEDGDRDSSWCDLTDVSSTTVTKMGSGDLDDISPTLMLNHPERDDNGSENYLFEMYDARITDLMNIITELQKQNLSLNEDVAKYERDLSLRNTKAETSIHNLADEVVSLKSGLQDLTEIKTALKNNHFTVSSQWQSTINTLNKKLYATENDNLALKAEITKLKAEFGDLSSQKQKVDASVKQKLCDIHATEIKMLKQTHVKHVASIEQNFTQILTANENEFSQRLRNLKTFYERKLFDIISEYDKTVNNRNVEIERLESTIENQCERMHEEVRAIGSQIEKNSNANGGTNLEKIAFLQKCLWKMDRFFKKSEKKYNKHITKLKQEIEMKDKAIQIQLTTQRAELLATTNTKRQEETDATVMLLEKRYKKLLDSQQARFLSDKQNDAKLICALRAMLARNNIAK